MEDVPVNGNGTASEDPVYNLVKVEDDPSIDNADFKYYFSRDGFGPVNPLHDIPLYADEKNGILNMVVEIPRGTNAKLEIKTSEPLAPIVQDRKKGKLRYVANVYPYSGYLTSYGYFPQTYEDPSQAHAETGALGDGDPLDVCNISDRPTRVGEVLQVKVVGVLGMIDEGEMDWKVIVINADDPMADKVQDVDDLYRILPGLVHATFSWFRTYKVPDGKALNVFAFREQVQPKAYAMDIIEECYHSWKKIVTGEAKDKNHDPLNTTLEWSKFCVSIEEARKVINKSISEFSIRASAATNTSSGSMGRSGSWLDMTHIPPPEFGKPEKDETGAKPMMTIKRFCTELQRKFPHGSNDLSLLITELGVAFKCVRAQLCDAPNASFSALQQFANSQIHASLASSGLCCLIYSSMSAEPMALEKGTDVGNYVVVFNPLCGAPGASVGSIFSVYYRKSAPGKEGDIADLLQRPGYDQVAAGYCLYGSSTFLTFSMGYGVHSFTLDVISGHFVLSKQHIHTPAVGPLYSIDTSVLPDVVDGVRKFVEEIEAPGAEGKQFRHFNNLVANFHNVLNKGGILMLPGPQKEDLGKFLTEAAPLAFVARQAGGRASVGKRHLLELSAWSLEMSVPCFVGSSKDVDRVEELVLGHAIEEKNKVDPSTMHKVV